MATYHSNSTYGKLQALLSGDQCPCRATKKREKPFCWDCFKDLQEKDLGFLISKIDSTEKGLDEYENLIIELGYEVK